MNDEVRRSVADAIRDHGPITFAEYMDLALYGPGGYYERPPIGPSGDFVTSPHVHPVFGQLVAEALRDLWWGLGEPDPFHLIDVGAGDGTLLRQLMTGLTGLPLRPIAVERSGGARAALSAIDGVAVLGTLPRVGGVVLAHELLDNLPFRWVRDGREIRVGVEGERLVEVDTPLDPELAGLGVGTGESTVPTGAIGFVTDVFAHGPRYLLAIDYGDVGTATGAPHGYRSHLEVNDVLAEPGANDITAGVDFAAVARAAHEAGATPFPTVTQTDALRALGFEAWIATQLERQRDLLGTGRGSDAVRAWGGRSRASMLVDPAGLGRFRWFLAASPGLNQPDWWPVAEPSPPLTQRRTGVWFDRRV
jgi:NADH dehydrogenase [ubiquinone] 1 alpha subcomplex assembly factor 7